MEQQFTATAFLISQISGLLANDTVGFGTSANIAIRLAKNSFTPSRDLVAGDLVEADFGGYAALTNGTGVSFSAFDASRQLWSTYLRMPASSAVGWRWLASSTTNLPQTIYGVYLQRKTGSLEVLASALLPAPVPIVAVNDYVRVLHPTVWVSNNAVR